MELARTQNDDLLRTLQEGFKCIEDKSFDDSFQGLFSKINLDSEKRGFKSLRARQPVGGPDSRRIDTVNSDRPGIASVVMGRMIDTELRNPEFTLAVHNALIVGEEFGKVLPQYSRAHGLIKNNRIIFNKICLSMIFGGDPVMILAQGIMRHIRERGPVISADGLNQPVMECLVLGVLAK